MFCSHCGLEIKEGKTKVHGYVSKDIYVWGSLPSYDGGEKGRYAEGSNTDGGKVNLMILPEDLQGWRRSRTTNKKFDKRGFFLGGSIKDITFSD